MEQNKATECGFLSKPGLQGKVSTSIVDGKVDTSIAGNSVPTRGWTVVAKLGGKSAYIEHRVMEEEVVSTPATSFQ